MRIFQSCCGETKATRRIHIWRALAPLLAVGTLLGSGQGPHGDEVTKWNELMNRLAVQAVLSDFNPNIQTRLQAMAHIAMHDALNTIDRRYQTYTPAVWQAQGASPRAAVAAAAHTVLVDQWAKIVTLDFPDFQAELDAAYQNSLAEIPAGPWKALGIQAGKAAASRILNNRASDSAYLLPVIDPNYPQGTRPGEYQFTPPFTFAFETQWGSVRPFALRSSRQFYPDPPHPIDSRRYAEDYNEVKSLGGDGVTTPTLRTADQTQIALFWLESSPVSWNRMARDASERARLDPWETARLFALLNIALTDGYIGVGEAKYGYNFWRPITAIRKGSDDGNNQTAGDPSWTPLMTTPPSPDHDSGHAVEGSAAAEVLERLLGERFPFRACSGSLPEGNRCGEPGAIYRSYRSFSQAASENGVSRIYVGFHFRRAVTEGMKHGRDIGRYTVQNYLRPLRGHHLEPIE